MTYCKGTAYFTSAMKAAGVEVRVNGKVRANGEIKRRGTLHHKFILVDSELLFCGSLNVTLHAVLQSYEEVVCTTVPDMVNPYRDYFERIWQDFDAPWSER